MKKNYIVIAVLATVALMSCVQEKPFNGKTSLGDNDIAFVINNTPTRAMESLVQKGSSIPAGKMDNGESFILEETIEELNPNLVTKGIPAYTVNVGSLYTTMGVYADGDFGQADFEKMDEDMTDNPAGGTGWRYRHVYGGDPWPDETTPVDFYLNMPAAPSGVTITKRENLVTEFTYTSPSTAAAQQDILFAQTSISKEEHENYKPNGAPVMMYHALTGVKFRSGWENNNGTKTIITGVKWNGLKSSGTCTFSPTSESIVEWNSLDGGNTSFTQGFTDQAWSDEDGDDGTVNYISGDNNNFGDSWYAGTDGKDNPSNLRNLNDEDGSLTFWFIPQSMNAGVTLEVSFKVKINETQGARAKENTLVINFGEQLAAKNVVWKAGELRTYTLKPFFVDVEISDEMADQDWTKKNVTIDNTGNVPMFVRVNIIGNWVGKRQESADPNDLSDETVLMGYTDNTMTAEVARWGDKEFSVSGGTRDYGTWTSATGVTYTYYPFGEFTGLPGKGTKTGPGNQVGNWIRHDKYYYYMLSIGPGESITPSTAPLFTSYKLSATGSGEYLGVPAIWIADHTGTPRKAHDVHLVMDLIVQAISADGYDEDAYEAAWIAALNPTNDPNFNFNDL